MIAPYGPYVTGDGAVVNIAVQTRAQWESLCRVVLDVQRSRRTSASAPTTDGSRTASSLT